MRWTKTMNTLKTYLVASLVLAAAATAQTQEFQGIGYVDWNNRVIVAKGIGAPNPNAPEVAARPMAIQAARTDALRNTLELIKGIQMTSQTTVENFMVTNDVVTKQVQGYISTFKESDPKYLSDKTIEITVTVPMDNKLAEALLPASIGATPSAVISAPSGVQGGNFTGLIIDARGTGAIPALAPKVLDEDGREIYGSAYVKREWAVKWGMAGYAKSPEQAAQYKDRVGDSPSMIKAQKATGASKCDLVISNQDAQVIQAAAKNMKFLSDCKVIIIID
jgi:hypothetical protein